MKVLIDIGHPAHVHLFKNLAKELIKNGHNILFTCREKEYEKELLEAYNFRYKSFGKKYYSTLGKILGLFRFGFKVFITGYKFKPDILLSHGSPYAAHASFLLKRPHISLEDSGNMEQIRLYLPFSKAVITPDLLPINLGEKQIRYKAFHELAYLHPKYFNPDASILKHLNVTSDDRYCILRFVSWKATHDEGHTGFTSNQKERLIELIRAQNLKIFITSETELPDHLLGYRISVPPELLHDALYFASIVIGEGATVASEAGVLGTVSVYVNTIRRSYCEDQERFGLVYNFQDGNKALNKIQDLISDPNSLKKHTAGRNSLLNEKIDVTEFLVWFIENWPKSYGIMKHNPDHQFRFRTKCSLTNES